MTRYLLSICTLGVFVLSAAAPSVAADRSTQPNVLLICVDDLKPTLGCFGDSHAKTPNIDRLAARGVTFLSAYCNQAVCSPSRNALLTSLRPQTLGIYDLPTNFRLAAPQAVTLPQFFRKAGYRAEAMGKIFHVGHGNTEDSASWNVPHYRPKTPTYANPNEADKRVDNQGKVKGAVTEAAEVADEAYHDGGVAGEAIKRLDAAAQRKVPFFIAVGFIRPHLPFIAPKRYWDLYDPETLPMPIVTKPPKGAPEYAPTNFGELRAYAGVPERAPIDEQLTRHLIHGYYAATSYTDAQVGKVVDALDRNHMADNTIIVLWGDHGWHLGDHGMWCKHTNYEQAASIPVIVTAPGLAKNADTQAMIESVDIYPTLAELAGLGKPAGVDGVSFAATVRDPGAPARESVIHVYPRGNRLGRAIRTARYRMVEWKPVGASKESAEYELYDYQSDPLETKNIAALQPTVLKELQDILATHPEPRPQLNAKASGSGNAKASKGKSDRAAMFDRRDRNQDDVLSEEEFMLNQPDGEAARQRFPQFDRDRNGVLSRAEFIGK
ncbi:MAG: sulfatase-like hydrolase/transferase [Planctomycetaceae bacterium]